jgi:hypothetical protein
MSSWAVMMEQLRAAEVSRLPMPGDFMAATPNEG